MRQAEAVAADPAGAGTALADRLDRTRWALLAGNFVIASGVMVVTGTLNDLARDLQVSVAVSGQLITIAAAVMCFGAPALAGIVAGWDRRRLLTLALLWYGVWHLISAMAPSFAVLLPVRALTVLGAAVFTPQAAAAIGFMTTPQQRGRAITFIFLGWSLASVLGVPMGSWIGETAGWASAFAVVGVLSFAAAAAVWWAMPDGVKPAALSLEAWKSVFTSPVLMVVVLVTALMGAGQFTLFSYLAPYLKHVIGLKPTMLGLLFFWFGLFGFIGNVLLSRYIDRIGAARSVMIVAGLIALGLLVWPLATTALGAALVIIPWGLGCFSSNSAQQARLGLAAPLLAPALMALNTSAIYLGQALGAAGGGWLITHGEARGPQHAYEWLSWVGVGWLVLALILSGWAARRMRGTKGVS